MSRCKATLLFVFAVGLFHSKLAQAESIGFSLRENGSGGTQILVVDDTSLEPISDALVTIQDESLRSEDLQFTGLQGFTYFASQGNGPKTVTAVKEGYVAATLIGAQSPHITLYLKPLETTIPKVVGSGITTGWERADLTLGKPVYMGLVFRSLKAYDLLQFNVGMMVSPLKDEIDVFGKRKIPSNLVMPEESIPIFLGSVKVNKPNYRFPVPSNQETKLVFVQGQINSSDLISIGQSGKMDPSALNKIQFDRLGLTDAITPSSDFHLDMHADRRLEPAHSVTVDTPPFVSDVLVAAVADLNGDWQSLLLTDVKAAMTKKDFRNRGPTTLRSSTSFPAESRTLITIAMSRDLKRVSGIVTPSAGAHVSPGSYLNAEELPDSPTLPEQVKIKAPTTGIGEVVFRAWDDATQKAYPIWTVYTLPSAGEVRLPTQNLPIRQEISQYAAIRLEFDNGFDERNLDGQTIITRLKRFSSEIAHIKTGKSALESPIDSSDDASGN